MLTIASYQFPPAGVCDVIIINIMGPRTPAEKSAKSYDIIKNWDYSVPHGEIGIVEKYRRIFKYPKSDRQFSVSTFRFYDSRIKYLCGATVPLFNYMRARLHTEKKPCRLITGLPSTAGRNASNSRDASNSMVDNNSKEVGKRRNPSKTASARKQNGRQISWTARRAGKPATAGMMAKQEQPQQQGCQQLQGRQ